MWWQLLASVVVICAIDVENHVESGIARIFPRFSAKSASEGEKVCTGEQPCTSCTTRAKSAKNDDVTADAQSVSRDDGVASSKPPSSPHPWGSRRSFARGRSRPWKRSSVAEPPSPVLAAPAGGAAVPGGSARSPGTPSARRLFAARLRLACGRHRGGTPPEGGRAFARDEQADFAGVAQPSTGDGTRAGDEGSRRRPSTPARLFSRVRGRARPARKSAEHGERSARRENCAGSRAEEGGQGGC